MLVFLNLLDESRCERVHRFAVRALRANRAFLDELDAEVLAMFLTPSDPQSMILMKKSLLNEMLSGSPLKGKYLPLLLMTHLFCVQVSAVN